MKTAFFFLLALFVATFAVDTDIQALLEKITASGTDALPGGVQNQVFAALLKATLNGADKNDEFSKLSDKINKIDKAVAEIKNNVALLVDFSEGKKAKSSRGSPCASCFELPLNTFLYPTQQGQSQQQGQYVRPDYRNGYPVAENQGNNAEASAFYPYGYGRK